MKRFNSIEGLRGWLAWTVVLSHLAMTSHINAKGLGPAAVKAGQIAVLVFIIISGFVITHLVIERPEPYGTYLLRRFMRLFPLLVVTCIIGFFTSDIYAETLSRVPWASDYNFTQLAEFIAGIAHSDHEFFWAHAFAHLTMMHGAISHNLLPFSSSAFNPPAWSLSLEWQFYLVAPLVIALVRQPRNIIWVALVTAIFECAYQLGFLGRFYDPSVLPGAAGYFALGIASRIAFPTIASSVRYPTVIFALFLVLIPLGWSAVPLLVWTLVFVGLILDCTDARTASFAQIYRHAFESRVATYFGSRSYSVYLCHWPIIAVCHFLWLSAFPTALQIPTFVGVTAMVVPLTLIISELLYQYVERPGIAFGARLTRRSNLVTG